MTTTDQSFDPKAIIIKVLARAQPSEGLAGADQPPQAYAVAVSDLTLVTENTDLKQDMCFVVPPALWHNTEVAYSAASKALVPLTSDDLNTRLQLAIEAKDERAFYYQAYLTKNKKLGWPEGDYRETALHSAVMLGNKSIFEAVLKRMSDHSILESACGCRKRGGNVLHYIATFGQTELARSLIAIKPDLMQELASADKDQRDQPLFIALLKHNFELASLLFEYTVHNHINTLLISAVNEKSMRLVELLTGSEPVTVHEEVVMRKLLSYGSFLESTNWSGLDALHVVASCRDPIIFELVYKAYVAAGLLLSQTQGYGLTLLHYVINEGNSEAVIKLINCSDFDSRLLTMPDNNGITPLFSAAERGLIDVFKLLYALTDTNDLLKQNSNGETVLVSAIRGKNMEILNMLLSNSDVGAKLLDIDDNKGTSPLVFAVQSKNVEACQVLYDLMVSTQICKRTKPCGRGAMHWALVHRNIDVINVLQGNDEKCEALLLVKDARNKAPFQS